MNVIISIQTINVTNIIKIHPKWLPYLAIRGAMSLASSSPSSSKYLVLVLINISYYCIGACDSMKLGHYGATITGYEVVESCNERTLMSCSAGGTLHRRQLNPVPSSGGAF
jgi:hypothetical protein